MIKNNKGFSLVELTVASAIMLAITVSIGNVFTNGQQSYFYLEGSARNLQEARLASDQASRDIRTTTAISTAGNNSFVFSGDFDGNGTTESITYAKSGVNFNRTIGTVTRTIATGLVNNETFEPVFRYFDQDGAVTTITASVRLVEIDFRIDNDPTRSPSRSTRITTRIQLRNLHERR